MTAAELQLRTIEPAACRCLGLNLLPLTIGHRQVMRKLGCFPPRDPSDLAMCCFVCSLPAGEAIPTMRRWWFKLWAWAWGVKLGCWDWREKLVIFADYVRYNTELPVAVQDGGGASVESVLPFDLHLSSFLMERLNMRRGEIVDLPVLEALWLRATVQERDGKVRYINKTESDIRDETEAVDWEAVRKAGESVLAGGDPC